MSTLKRWDGAVFVDLSTFKRWDGSTWVDITTAKRWDGANWIDITLPGGGGGTLTATISNGSVGNGSVGEEETCPTITSQSTTVTATGGTGPYTYLWTRLSGSSAILCDSPTTATTTFSASICVGSRSGVWRCTVEDSLGATDTVDCSITLDLV